MFTHRLPLAAALTLLFVAACEPTPVPLDDTAPDQPVEEIVDEDGDGFAVEDDCDDQDDSVHPDAEEVCDGVDNDCNGEADEAGQVFYRDRDNDGYGDPGEFTSACELPAGHVDNSDDCNDTDVQINPGMDEICDGLDNDCDGALPAEESDLDTDGLINCIDDDDDGDLLTDTEEQTGSATGVVTDPMDADTDGDGYDDGYDIMPIDPLCGEWLYQSDFANTMSEWTVAHGNWDTNNTSSNGAYAHNYPDVAGEQMWLANYTNWTDYVIHARLQAQEHSAHANSGLVFRQTDAGNTSNNSNSAYYLGLSAREDFVQFGVQDGGWAELARETLALEEFVWYDVRVELFGSSIRVYVDDDLIVDMTDSTHARGSIGLRSYYQTMRYQDVDVCR